MKIVLQFKVLLLSVIGVLIWTSQDLFAQEYKQITEVPVFKSGEQLSSPWAGGLNAPQFCEIDLNDDGSEDLFVFDKESKRSFTFIYTTGEQYIFEPSYALNFPPITSWVILEDYNCDGIKDLITHRTFSPITYKGFYQNGAIHFEADKNEIYYEGSSGNILNLTSPSTHPPVFVDINGDGDKDFLTFGGASNYSLLSYFENLRIEKNIPCDSLFFDRVDRCWGNFKETGGITLDLILDDTCDLKFNRMGEVIEDDRRHPGGTVIDVYDADNNGVYDLVLGDITFERINYISNNGTPTYANFSAQDDSFPSYDQMVSMSIFPAPHFMDIDKDGDQDLIVAPFNIGAIENFENVWYYKNNGGTAEQFSLQQTDFLVGQMIDVGEYSNPAFFDENNDGLQDIVIGNDGYYLDNGEYLYSLTLYRNTGTTAAPEFTFVTNNYLSLDVLGINDLAPYFADIDGDDDKDLLCGERDGRILMMTNDNGTFNNPRFLKDNNFLNIDVGQFSDPEVVDFNNDELLDLIIGCKNGNVFYYENTGSTTNFEFTLRTDSLGKVTSKNNLQGDGYSSPSIGDFDNDGKADLLLGGFSEGVKFYSNIGQVPNVPFTLTSSNFFNETNYSQDNLGAQDPRLKPTAADISGDGLPEVLLGINNGGLLFYSQDTSLADTTVLVNAVEIINHYIKLYPNPTSAQLHISWGSVFSGNDKIELALYNAIGEQMLVTSLPSTETEHLLDVSTFPSGIYLLNLQQNNKLGTVRVVKF
ncbi:MAG: T9SS type A sorting domain-containing protein [Chitinophagales bacterium]